MHTLPIIVIHFTVIMSRESVHRSSYILYCSLAFSFACTRLFINLMFARVHIDVGKRKYIHTIVVVLGSK